MALTSHTCWRHVSAAALVAMAIAWAPGGTSSALAADPADSNGRPVLQWEHRFGTGTETHASAVAAGPSDSTAVVGSTWGVLGDASAGGEDAFVRLFDADGNVAWTRQFGSTHGDRANGVAVDTEGRIIVVGSVGGALPDESTAGYDDGFVRVYDTTGTLAWSRQFGTGDNDAATAVAVGHDSSILVGGTSDVYAPWDPWAEDGAFVRSYQPDGSLQWSVATSVPVRAIAVDLDGDIWLAGGRAVAVLGSDGSGIRHTWIDDVGEPEATAIARGQAGEMLVAGQTAYDMGGATGDGPTFVRSYRADGTVNWTRQSGSAGEGKPALAADVTGDYVIAGRANCWDYNCSYSRAYASDGTLRSSEETSYYVPEATAAIAFDPSGGLVAAGTELPTWIADIDSWDGHVMKSGQMPPTARITALPSWTLTASAPVAWTAIQARNLVVSYDVRYRRAPWNGTYGAYVSMLSGTTDTSDTLSLSPGYTYCASARARDDTNLTSAWAETCTSAPLDDRSLTRSAGWTAGTGSSFYQSTYLRSSTLGAKLSRSGIQAKRIALLATTCPTCGSVKLYWGSTLLKTVSLYSATTVNRKLISVATFTSVRAGTLSIKVASSGKRVYIDGVAVRRN